MQLCSHSKQNRESIVYVGSEAAFSRMRWMKRPLWKLLPATSTWWLSNGYATLVSFPSLNKAYPIIRWASIPSTQSVCEQYI